MRWACASPTLKTWKKQRLAGPRQLAVKVGPAWWRESEQLVTPDGAAEVLSDQFHTTKAKRTGKQVIVSLTTNAHALIFRAKTFDIGLSLLGRRQALIMGAYPSGSDQLELTRLQRQSTVATTEIHNKKQQHYTQ
ncbi:hypothetical protein NDU88_002044 [Pleurodeles waltl]|uniref:Uncharacterized protein n=1 Tax=Pleurodeles waltl TaxID=8319 RepID=A0AAV7LBG5_PLEWA|nr:hypothetical protein NDU88_002044 [Pleurodeles waltl]